MRRVQHYNKKPQNAFSRAIPNNNNNNNDSSTNTPTEQQHQQNKVDNKNVNNKHQKQFNRTTPRNSNENQIKNLNIPPPQMSPTFTCVICCEDRPVRTIYEGCNHTDVCHRCALRLRVLNNDDKCCICKTTSETVILTRNEPKNYKDYNKDNLIYDPTWKFYTEDQDILNEIISLRAIECKICKKQNQPHQFEDEVKLNQHMKHSHDLQYCNLCLKNRKVFLEEQKLYNHGQLMKHLKHGEEDPIHGKIEGHPLCKFCNIRFYCDDDIFQHMYKNHERCFICEKHGIQFEFYRNYKHLEEHFEAKHYLCPYTECREKGFIVFENELDLIAHKNKVHSDKMEKKSSKMVLDFASLGSMAQTNTDQFSRRRVRVGDVDSNIIRFVDTANDDHGENEHSHQQPTKSYHKKGHQQQRREMNEDRRYAHKHHHPNHNNASSSSSNGENTTVVKEKNNTLVKKMKEALGNNQNKFQELKTYSTQFLRNELLATEYYTHFVEILGEGKAKELFDDLIDLIPAQDEQKKKALMLARNTYHSPEFRLSAENSKSTTPTQDNQSQELWPSLSKDENGGSSSSGSNVEIRASWNPQTKAPTKKLEKEQKKLKEKSTIEHGIVRGPDLQWGKSSPTGNAFKIEEFPTLSNTTTSSSETETKKKKSNNQRKPRSEWDSSSGKPTTQVGGIKVFAYGQGKKILESRSKKK
ncbi:hypothetical protein ABK040_003383 [Willaertia magna]